MKTRSKKTRVGESADEAVLRRARADFKTAMSAREKQLERENEDIAFYNSDQWPADVAASRAGQEANNGMPPIPARPCLVINRQREPVRQVLNMERNSDLGFELVPVDDFAGISVPVDDSEVELREGLVRRVQRDSSAASARTWAFERGVISGTGYYGVSTRYGDGKTGDQEIYVERFWDQGAVLLVGAFEPDGSDAEAAFVGLPMPYDQYAAEYPTLADESDNPNAGDLFADTDFTAYVKDYPDWFGTNEDGTRWVRVVRYWYYTRESRKLAMFPDGTAVWFDELPEGAVPQSTEAPQGYTTRMVVEKRVKLCKIDGTQILEKVDWPGKYIPVIKYVAEQLQPVKGEMREEGMVRPGRDAQRGSNYMISKGVEMVGLTPIPPLILDPESITGYEEWYYSANTRTLPFLPQRTRGDDGREFREAHRPNVDPNIAPVAAFIQLFDESIQSTMSVHDPSTGKVDPRLKSGKAIQAVIAQDAHGTSNFIDNLGRSIHYEATIINDLLYPIYGRPGRITKMLGKDNTPQTVMLHQPFTTQAGRPMPAQPGDPNAQTYTLTKDARFTVAIKITKNYDLKRDQVSEFLGGLIQADPNLMQVYGDMLFNTLDVPGHQEFAERAKAMLAPPIQKLLESKQQGLQIPPSVQAQMQQGQQIIEHLTKTVQALEQQVQTDGVKQQHEDQRTQWKLASDKDLKGMELMARADEAEKDRAAKIEIARISAAKQQADPAAEAAEERMALGLEQQHDVAMASADAAHEERMAQLQHQNDLAAANQAAQHAQAGMVTQAALQPPDQPTPAGA